MFLHDVVRTITLVALLLAGLTATPRVCIAADAVKGLKLMLPKATQQRVSDFYSSNKYALVVGINRYQNGRQGIAALKYAVGDARAVYNALIDPRVGGFKPGHVTLLTDDTPVKPTDTEIGRALSRLAIQAREDDLVLLFFSGHGVEHGGRAYLLPINADLEALDNSALERDALMRQVDQIGAKKVVVILDACHSGGVSRGGKSVGSDPTLIRKYYERFVGSQGRAFIASSGDGEQSWEDDDRGRGVFTSVLVDGLSGRADAGPQDGVITLNEVRSYVENEVSAWAARRGKTQHPQVSLEEARGDIPLALNHAYLESQSQDIGRRRAHADSIRARLVKVPGLGGKQLAGALGLVDRYAEGEAMSDADLKVWPFVQKLAEGSIDLAMFRDGAPDISVGSDRTDRAPSPVPPVLGATLAMGAGLLAFIENSAGNDQHEKAERAAVMRDLRLDRFNDEADLHYRRATGLVIAAGVIALADAYLWSHYARSRIRIRSLDTTPAPMDAHRSEQHRPRQRLGLHLSYAF